MTKCVTYPYFVAPIATPDWCSADILMWCQNNIGQNCSAEFMVMLSESDYDGIIYVDTCGVAGVPLHDDSFCNVMFFPEDMETGEPITRFYFRDPRYAVMVKTAVG